MNTKMNRRTFGAFGLAAAASVAMKRPAGAEAKKVVLWGEWSGEGEVSIKAMVDAFNAAQSDIVVEYVIQQDMATKFLTGATSGQVPDVMIWDRWQTTNYAPRGVLHAIDEHIANDGVDIADFYEQAVAELSYDGKTYGLPLTVDARALFYNKAHFAEAGVEPPTTWDELYDAAAKLTQREGDKLQRSGFSVGDVGLFSMYNRQAGGTMLTEDNSKTNFNNEKGISVLDYWKKYIDDGLYEIGFESGLGEGTDAFVTGKVSMLYTGPWMINGYKKYGDELDFGVVQPVTGPNGDKGAGMGGFGLVIPEGSKDHDSAWAFVKWWLADQANATMWGTTSNNIPGNQKAAQDPVFTDDEHLKPVIETLEYAVVRPTVPGYAPMEIDALIPNLQLFMEGKQDAATSLEKAQKDGDRVLQENKL